MIHTDITEKTLHRLRTFYRVPVLHTGKGKGKGKGKEKSSQGRKRIKSTLRAFALRAKYSIKNHYRL